MDGRQLLFHDEARERIERGMRTLAEAVVVTLGPRGRTVILERDDGAPQIVDSGVRVARSVELADRFENMGAQLLREVAARTGEQVGDGTTTATVLAQSMITGGLRYLAAGMNPTDVRRGIDAAVAAVVAELARLARPCDDVQAIARVAAISANNDPAVGDLIARAMVASGREGAISVEEGAGATSTLEIAAGLRFEHGFLSPRFVNDVERQRVVLEDASILLVDGRLAGADELRPLLDALVEVRRPLLVVAEDVDDDALAALASLAARGALACCAVRVPGSGARRREILEDIAVVVGGDVVRRAPGVPPDRSALVGLGRAWRVEIGNAGTTIVGGAGDAATIRARIAAIEAQRSSAARGDDRARLTMRASRLAGGVAVIRVGAATGTERRERRIRIEDAVHATRAAVEEGLVPGGGVALLRARRVLDPIKGPTLDHYAGLRIVERALEEPLRRIVQSAGDDPVAVLQCVDASPEPGFGYDAATREYGDLFAMGVVDAVKVTRLALQNAASIAGLLLTTDCMIARPQAQPPAAALALPEEATHEA